MQNHHLNIGIDLPDLLDGLDPVPSRRHANINEGQRVWGPGGDSLLHHLEARFSLVSETQFEGFAMNGNRRLVEQGRSLLIEFVRGGSILL